MAISQRTQLPLVDLCIVRYLLSLAVPTCHCRALHLPDGRSSSGLNLSTWKTAVIFLFPMLLALTAFNLLRRVILRRRNDKPHPKSVNGGMVRSYTPRHSDKVWSCSPDGRITITGDNSDLGPGRLGVVKHIQRGSRLMVSRPDLTTMKMFDYDMLAHATNDFNSIHKLKKSTGSSNSSGTMFWGSLVSDEGLETPVAIKKFHHRFSDEMSNHVSEDLKGHVLWHRNLLCPLGYSLSKGKLYIVYKYMVKGSLDQHLSHVNQGLSWDHRCRIINGVASGLHHLHHNEAVHGSVKVSNILLDQDMTARLGDFGYSRAVSPTVLNGFKKLKSFLERNTCSSPKTIMGSTIGNPTYEMDVFYFGVVILHVVCGGVPDSQLQVDRVWAHHHDGNILGAVDAKLVAACDFKEAEAQKLLLMGLACFHPDPSQRPCMEHVVKILTGGAPLPAVPLEKPTHDAAPCG